MSQEADRGSLPPRKVKRKCWGTNRWGEPCQAPPLGDVDYCRVHDNRPGAAEARRESSAKGGKIRTKGEAIPRVSFADVPARRTCL